MPNHSLNGAWSPRGPLAVYPLTEVQPATDELPAPTFVADAVIPERTPGKWRVRPGSIADEAACGVGVKGEKEGNEEVVSIPEGFVGLLPYANMRCGEHHQHAKEHDVSSDSTSFCIMNLHRRFRAHLIPLNVEEAVGISNE